MPQYIYGKNVVRQRILNHLPIQKLFIDVKKNQDILELVKQHKIPYEPCDAQSLNRYATHHQGVVAQIEDYRTHTLTEVLKTVGEEATLLMLDGLEDPQNLGAILRSADAAHLDGVILPKHGSVQLNATVARVSTGAIDTVKTIVVTNLNSSIEDLKKAGFWIYGAEYGPKAKVYTELIYPKKTVFVVGSEGKGISRLVKQNCDELIKIPMLGSVNSLNASVSAALLMYEVIRQRQLPR
jgi:23S rRNA (guanosine2251-2'-O)-methyltransferase